MLFIRDNEILYSLERNEDGSCDVYNFQTMQHNPNAFYPHMELTFRRIDAREANDYGDYRLVLDFLANQRNQLIDGYIQRLTELLTNREYHVHVNENPLSVVSNPVTIYDVCLLIQLPEFQTLHKELVKLSVWHLYRDQ
jgi:hypothetical protein